ncbi:helix-hairpin-helix domain-containing protein [Demequina sp. SO4-13]|uniref:helix-hairpin-helix domain-containing protein n=1 Tax=Demequina sp. SO4-13 TaxID=3401027 RepID=UPI003AF9D73D
MPRNTPDENSADDRDALARPPGSEVSERWADSAARVASRAYAAAYGREIADDATRVRWRLEPRVAVTAAVALTLLGIGAWWAAQAEPALPAHVQSSAVASVSHELDDGGTAAEPALATPTADADGDGVIVHVSGAVGEPGLVELPADARIADAIERAGGATPEADLAAVNLARQPHDGEQVHVPVVGEAPAAADPAAPVDLNSATAEELEELPGIGPVLASRIVADRDAQGPFSSVEDLARVSGVGDALVAGLADAAVA